MATDPKWQISFRGLYDSLRLLYIRVFNEDARTVEIMELQLTHRIELMLTEERICLERHEQELAVPTAQGTCFISRICDFGGVGVPRTNPVES